MATEDHKDDGNAVARQLGRLLAGLSEGQLRRIIRSLVGEEPELLKAVLDADPMFQPILATAAAPHA